MAQKPRSRLGRGLSSLISDPVAIGGTRPTSPTTGSENPDKYQKNAAITAIAVGDVKPNRYQPRTSIDRGSLDGLAASIRTAGVMQPILVRPADGGDGWELVAGERRWRAAGIAGLDHVPAIVVDLDDQQAAEWAVVENVQREDLNPVERGMALKRLAETFHLSQQEIAERVGIDRSSVANLIRITTLEERIQMLLADGSLTAGHAKAILAHPPGDSRVRLASQAAREGWSVRKLEQWGAPNEATVGRADDPQPPEPRDVAAADIAAQLAEQLGTRVTVRTDASGARGRITIEFYDLDHFDGLMKRIGVTLRS